MFNSRLLWVILPYVFAILGITVLNNAWGALIGFHIGLLPVLLPNSKEISQSLFAPVSKRLLLIVALSGLFAGAGLWILWPYLGIPVDFQIRVAALGLSKAMWPSFIVYFALVNPWLEEAYWRYIFASYSPYPALVDCLYAGYHMIILYRFVGLAWMAFAFVILGMVAWFWRQVSRYTHSLLPAVFAHTLADLSILFVLYRFATFPI